MERIAIIGNAGGGKSELARKLGYSLNIPVFQFNDLQWQPGWTHTPEGEIQDAHSKWLTEPKWVIDGWGNWDIIGARFELADTIVFIDFHIAVHYWWAIKRQFKAVLNLNQGWPPEGCQALPVTLRLFKLMWTIHKEIRPHLVELVYEHAKSTHVIHLKSPREMRELLRKLDYDDPDN